MSSIEKFKIRKSSVFAFSPTTALLLATVALLAGYLAFANQDFPFGFHPDEGFKVAFSEGQAHNYKHPPLLIVLARIVGWCVGAASDHDFLIIGRSISAVAVIGSTVALYLTLMRLADPAQAFIWACIFAASPVIAVHGHYFKEDALLVLAICLGLHALLKLKAEASLVNILYFGFVLGIAISAKYPGVVNSAGMFLVAAVWGGVSRRQLGVVALMATATVGLVFVASFATQEGGSIQTVIAGFLYELGHAQRGHDLKEWFWAGYGLTHFVYHLVPGLTGFTVLVGILAIGLSVSVDRNRTTSALAIAALLWLFILELSPLKLVGSVRYVLPIVPYLVAAACVAFSTSVRPRYPSTAVAVAVVALSITFHAGYSYVRNMEPENDTRLTSAKFVAENHLTNVMLDYPAGLPDRYENVGSYDYLVSTRFRRYDRGGRLSQQDQITYKLSSMFHCLDGHVIGEFSKVYGDFATVAPTVKIYDLKASRNCIPTF
ncbi:MAG: hypothetical protein E5Y04_23470 [Mesorhizobium sp.]|nr:MAG: hypothetical protein E5Y04_23470 [Mesorhizobium sp.]